MPDRIFTTNEAPEGLGPAEAINTIDVASVARTMKELREGPVPSLSPEIITQIASSNLQSDLPVHEAIRNTPDGRAPEKSKMKFAVNTKGTCEICGVPHPCSHDVMQARQAGNDVAVSLMNEVRNQRRLAMLGAHQQRQVQAADQQKTQQRQAIAKGLTELEEAIKRAQVANKKTPAKKTSVKTQDPKFESFAEMSDSKRERFVKWAKKQGWPKEYIEAQLSRREVEASIPTEVKVIAERKDITENQKREIITAMLKEAELEPEQADRIRRFWKEELGYQDAEWVDDLVAEPDNK